MTNAIDKTKETTEWFGKYSVGDRIVFAEKVVQVAKAAAKYWSEDRCEDEDEFDKLESPGWYTTVELAEVEPTDAEMQQQAEIRDRKEAEAAEKEERRREHQQYEADLADLKATHATLIEGLRPAGDTRLRFPEGTTHELVGRVCEPERGASCVVALHKTTDPSGRVIAVSFGSEVDYGPSYWATEELLAKSESAARVLQWWSPKGYGADSYPGPQPGMQLTAEEQDEVDRLYAAKFVAIAAREIRTLKISAEHRLRARGYTGSFTIDATNVDWRLYDADKRANPVRCRLVVPVGTELPREIKVHNFATAEVCHE